MQKYYLTDEYIEIIMISFDWLKGKKTYLLGAGAVLYGVLGLLLGYMTLDEAKNYIWAGFTAMAIKGAINKVA